MQPKIQLTWFFNHAPDKVWEFLTDAELLGQWVMKNNFKPVVGHHFQFKTKMKDGSDIVVNCEVKEIDPQKRLSYSWLTDSFVKGADTCDSIVTWTLTPKDNGTELKVQHTGFIELQDYLAHNDGWGQCVQKLFKLLTAVSQ